MAESHYRLDFVFSFLNTNFGDSCETMQITSSIILFYSFIKVCIFFKYDLIIDKGGFADTYSGFTSSGFSSVQLISYRLNAYDSEGSDVRILIVMCFGRIRCWQWYIIEEHKKLSMYQIGVMIVEIRYILKKQPMEVCLVLRH